MADNLAVRIASDPILNKNIFSRLSEPQFQIPNEYEESLKNIFNMKGASKGVLVSKVTSPEDYQTQLKLISMVQHLLDRVHDINTNLYSIQHKWNEMLKAANRIITLTYFDELNELKDGVRKTVLAVALQPVQDGVDKTTYLVERGESTYRHLNATNWNLKEGTAIVKEYLTLLKYGAGVKEL